MDTKLADYLSQMSFVILLTSPDLPKSNLGVRKYQNSVSGISAKIGRLRFKPGYFDEADAIICTIRSQDDVYYVSASKTFLHPEG